MKRHLGVGVLLLSLLAGLAIGSSILSRHARVSAAATTAPRFEVCCAPAPPILEFDQDGSLVGHWGGPGSGYDWPESNHGITVDYKGNVWIGGNGRGQPPGQ